MAHKSLQPTFGHERRRTRSERFLVQKILLAKNTLCQVLSKEADHLESLVLFAVTVHIHHNRHSVHTLNNSLIFVESNSVHIPIDLHGHMLSDHFLTPPSSHCSLEITIKLQYTNHTVLIHAWICVLCVLTNGEMQIIAFSFRT